MSLSNHKLTAEVIHLQILNLHFLIITEYLHYWDFLTHLLNSHIFPKNQIKSQLVTSPSGKAHVRMDWKMLLTKASYQILFPKHGPKYVENILDI